LLCSSLDGDELPSPDTIDNVVGRDRPPIAGVLDADLNDGVLVDPNPQDLDNALGVGVLAPTVSIANVDRFI